MENNLVDKHLLALILRLTLDRQGKLMHGEVVDLAGQIIGRFAEWDNLTHIVQGWVATQEKNNRLNSHL